MALAADRPGIHLRGNMPQRRDLAELVELLRRRPRLYATWGRLGSGLLGHRDDDGIVTHDPAPRVLNARLELLSPWPAKLIRRCEICCILPSHLQKGQARFFKKLSQIER